MKFTKNIKKNSLAVLSIMIMFVLATYINYEYNPEREKDLGQSVYVNSEDVVQIYEEVKTEDTKPIYEYEVPKEAAIAVFKYDRDNMFSELSENYRSIISNASTTNDKVNEYQEKLDKLLSRKNLITMVENIIKSKGIEDVVIIPTENDNLNVVIKSQNEITKEQIAQIQQTLVDEFGVKPNNITITVNND